MADMVAKLFKKVAFKIVVVVINCCSDKLKSHLVIRFTTASISYTHIYAAPFGHDSIIYES